VPTPPTNEQTTNGPKAWKNSITNYGPAASTKKRVPIAAGAFSGPALIMVLTMR